MQILMYCTQKYSIHWTKICYDTFYIGGNIQILSLKLCFTLSPVCLLFKKKLQNFNVTATYNNIRVYGIAQKHKI